MIKWKLQEIYNIAYPVLSAIYMYYTFVYTFLYIVYMSSVMLHNLWPSAVE